MNTAVESQRSPEAGSLAREMLQGLQEMVESYKDAYGLSHREVMANVQEWSCPEEDDQTLRGLPEALTWVGLERLLERDPDRALTRWEEVKQAARDELASGHRGAKMVERYGGTPWQLAQFLALRQAMMDGWQPHNGIERQLLETMAQAQTAVEYWSRVLMSLATRQAATEKNTFKTKGTWEPPRVTGFQAVEQAGAMVDRFNRIFLRTLRALRDLRRSPPPVVVHSARQVNVGSQQVNLATDRDD